MERFTYALCEPREGCFAYGCDFEDMKEDCDEYRANGYPDTVVKLQISGEIVYPHPIEAHPEAGESEIKIVVSQITAESHPDIWAILQPPALPDKEES